MFKIIQDKAEIGYAWGKVDMISPGRKLENGHQDCKAIIRLNPGSSVSCST